MPTSKRHFAPGPLQFLTRSTYRRAKLIESDRFRWSFVEVLAGCGKTRRRCHTEESTILIGGRRRISCVHENAQSEILLPQGGIRMTAAGAFSRSLLVQLRIEMGYPFGVYSEKKRLEKLNYMHRNPAKCGLVASPEQWPWSSFRFY